jgi:glycosyltransferase involved in cell wall biosynthesis
VDRGIELDPSAGSHNVDGIRYLHVRGPHLRRTGLDEFVDSAANALVAAAKKSRPAIMHAASNHVNALPALIAARRLGIPFVYEVRGLWELTAASRNLEWERSERFLLERSLETLVARHADRVLTLTEGLRAELVSRGVPADNIELLPNAVDAELFAPRRKHPETMLRFGVNSAFVLVYAGSLLHYEGLDDLLRATAMLVAEGVDVSLVLAGDGEALENLQRLSVELKLERRVKFLGRLAPGEIPDLWSVADAAAFPRKPFEVCQIVSPLKPLEPMAMAMPVVVSDVAALREMVRDDVTGLVHRAGDPASLAAKLRLLISDPALRERLGRAAREQILRERTWQVAGRRLAGLYGELQISGAIEPLELPSGRSSMTTEEKALFEAKLEEAYRLGGAKVLRELIRRQAAGRGARFLAFALLKAASLCQRLGDPLALELAREALGCEDSAATLRGVARIAYAAGEFVQAAAIVDRLESAAGNLTGKDDELAREVRGRARILQLLAEPIGVTARDQLPVAGRCVYFLHFSLPYSSVGYATRSHGLITGMQAAGCDVRAYTRCGFPFDFKPELEAQAVSEIDLVDGVEYHRLLEGGRRGSTESEYLLACVEAYERVLIAENPAIVHAASNYVTALPALIAARRLGLPFIYEIRGFWEITRSSRDNEFENSARYALMRHFEGVVAQAADHVFTLTSAMREELVRRGVEAGKITLVHNGVDPQRFVPLSPNRELAERIGLAPGVPVIGYVGSFVDYEGLDDLIQACALVAKGNLAFRLLLVGDGAEMAHLRQLTTQVGLEEHVLFTGRVPHEDVEGYYSLVDICPFPRKPWEVCEMVSPLKPFEAMAMRKAVVVSSTHALREIVNHGETGLVFDKGSPEALAETLRRLLSDHELRERLAENGRLWATQHRSWQASGRVVAEGYRALLEDRCSSNQSRVPA